MGNDTMTSRDPERSSRNLNTLTAQYLENSCIFYRVLQNKLHKVCYVINFEPFVLGLWD